MKKNLIGLLVVATLTMASSAFADHRKIVLLESMPVPVVETHSREIARSFTEMGYRQGHDVTLEILRAEGDKERAGSLLKKSLADKKPDLVIAVATLAAQAAVETLADTDIPLLFCVVSDPVGSGIVKQIGSPSHGNISGVVYSQQRQTKVEMVQRILEASGYDQPVNIGVVSSDYPSAIGDYDALHEIAESLQLIRFVPYHFPYKPVPEGLPEMHENLREGVEKMKGQVEFLWEVMGPIGEIETSTRILLESDIPLILGNTARAVEMGAVIAVLTDNEDTAKQLVEMAHQIFQGVEVGSLPVVLPRKFKLHINMKAATRHDLTVPSHLMMIAGDNLIY